jgi:ATP-dependent helicase Lhr and Lhr-like helicase
MVRMDALDRFAAPTREWFRASFAAPTAAQVGAWEAISDGGHALVIAPTGSGKTLAAFLHGLDGLLTREPPEDATRRCRVLYVSPLKALAVDVERNLRAPLAGIRHAATRIGAAVRDVAVAMRTGDTTAEERRAFPRRPPDILITTPESLFLLLTSQAREALHGVETVIVDEVHAVAGTKRGAHLALSLERLDALLDRPAQRVGLSATVRPVDEVARFLGGSAPVTVVQPPAAKTIAIDVVVPVEDMTELGEVATDERDGSAAGPDNRRSIWPAVEERIVDLVEAHRSTIVFSNSRRLAERLTNRLNEIAYERRVGDALPVSAAPAEVMAQAGAARGAPVEIARAHHGSVSREQRALTEDALKRGDLPCVVATSSLELGIDMGAVDLVVQVESPPSVASGLQRIGRAGHQVGAVSHGVMFPKHRGDLVPAAVVAQRMQDGEIEAVRLPRNPLDVLAQQVVAMLAMEPWSVDDLAALVRRTASFASLPDSALHAVLDMLAGRYPSDEFAELRPRIVWDRVTGLLTGRPGAQRLAVTSGGTIPDRGLFGVFLVGDKGSRVGELDEEMVYESRVGDVFTLGSTSWRIEDISHDRVTVSPAPGQPGKLPFWHGDAPARCVRPRPRPPHSRRRTRTTARHRARRMGRRQHPRVPRRAAHRYRSRSRRPHDRRRTVPRRTRRLASRRALAVRCAGARTVGTCAVGTAARAVRRRRAGDAHRRRHRHPAARDRRDTAAGACRLRSRRGRAARHRRGRRLGVVRVAIPRMRGPRTSAAASQPRPPYAVVAATATIRTVARGRVAVRLVPDRARDDARMPAGCLRRAGPRATHA